MAKLLFVITLFFATSIYCQQNLEDDFEGNGTITTWYGDNCGINIDFDNPFKIGINTSNKVLEYSDSGAQYANVRFDVSENFDLSSNSTFSIKIYVPSSGLTGNENNQISLKLQDGTLNEPWITQSEIIKTIQLNQWQTVTFDFANDNYINLNSSSIAPIYRNDFNRVLLQVNDENNNSHVTAYIDDISYDGLIGGDGASEDDPIFDNLVWSDEFDDSGALDAEKWHHQIIPILNGNKDWANGEIQHYTNREDNSYMSDGSLKIVAKKENYTYNNSSKNYTSARLNSKFAFTYGKVEIRAKMPTGSGTFPALWMLGQNITEYGGFWAATHGDTSWPDCGEIDIIEHWGTNQNFVQSALHNRSSFGNTQNKGGRVIDNASSEFHIYTIDWNSDRMKFSVDGINHYVYSPEEKNSENWPYDAPQYLLFNVAVLPEISSDFTQSAMEIDYVRVYQESANLIVNENSVIHNDISIFPNPVGDELTIRLYNLGNTSKIDLYNISGKKLFTINQDTDLKIHDVSFLKKGIYFLKIKTNSISKYFSIVKK